MNKGKLTQYFRSLGLMMILDKLKFYLFKIYNFRKNNRFRSKYNDVKLPPDYMLFESFKLDYSKYYFGGQQTAEWLVSLMKKHSDFKNSTVLDWGCGPARITRHLPKLAENSQIFGTDYNSNTISWCKDNLSDVHFTTNSIDQPLKFPDNKFSHIIGISIFTHLSKEKHLFWIAELTRVADVNGIVFLTTAGAAFKAQMTTAEIISFDKNQLTIRSNVTEGHRTFAAFQPKRYFEELINNNFDILEYKEGTAQSWGIEQDYWILKVKK